MDTLKRRLGTQTLVGEHEMIQDHHVTPGNVGHEAVFFN
jgi:hypothetical protein